MSTDGNLLNEFCSGNREAIEVVSARIAKQLTSNGLKDEEIIAILAQIFERISKGVSPNDAFGWKQTKKGRRKENDAYRNWDIRRTVQQRMIGGEGWKEACLNVSSDKYGEFFLTSKTIENICKGLTDSTPLPVPDNLYPMGDTESYRKPLSPEIK